MSNLIRWRPDFGVALHPFASPFSLLDEVEEMARDAFETSLVPKLDMYEEEKDLVVKAELPGIRKKDLDITLEGEVLTIKAEKKAEKEDEEGKHHTRERSFGQYVRYMTLPTRIDAENVSATLKKGLLEIRMPKAAAPEAKKIEIKTK